MENIHDRLREKAALARLYAKDGAFRTAAAILGDASKELVAHADWCDGELQKHVAGDPINLQGSGPAPIEPREGR